MRLIERRRQKATDRYVSMTDEPKAKRNAKRKENYHHKKVESRAANMTLETTGNCPNLNMCNNSIYPNMLMIITGTIPSDITTIRQILVHLLTQQPTSLRKCLVPLQ